MLATVILNAQNDDQDAMLTLLHKFCPLLRKYGRKLKYEDAFNDLTLDFIELILSINFSRQVNTSDAAITKYISKSIYHIYLKRLKTIIEKEPNCISIEALTPVQLNILSLKEAMWDEYSLANYLPQKILTDKELFVLISIYEDGLTATALARQLNVSRQNVNQIKKRAEKKLKERAKI